MKSMKLFGVAAAVAALAVVASGCGASSLDPVQSAGAATGQQSARMQMTMQVSTARGGFTADGRGAFRRGEGELAMTVHGGGKTVPLREIYTTRSGDVIVYLHSPAFAGQLPKGKTWAELDLTRAAKAGGGNLGSLPPGGQNPSDMLRMLRDTTSLKNVGTARVAGIETTHYLVTVDLKKLAADDPQAAGGLGQLQSQTGAKTLPIDVWIDGSNHVRRLRLRIGIPSSETGRLQMTLTMTMSSFGSPVTITPPPASKTVDLTAQVSKTTTA